ncbi:MAG: hypothetical protein KAS32_00555 [Candidatus Peribacteraceae bacterium]|nr:hypothetical protein [Candidatus Peribacteraceae bacterium]
MEYILAQYLPIISIALIFSMLIILLLFSNNIFNKVIRRVTRRDAFENYDVVLTILEVAKESAYQKVFRDDVLVHSASGYKINKEEIGKIQAKYLRLVFQNCGPKIVDDIEYVHGDLDSMSVILINEFISKIEEEERVITSAVSESKAQQEEAKLKSEA